MSASSTPELATFADVRAWLLAMNPPGRGLRVQTHEDGPLALARSRATVTVMAPGHLVPERFDHLLVVGTREELTQALQGFTDPRVHLLALPCHPLLVARVVEAAIESAEAFARARVTDQLLDIGLALNAERHPQRVLELILKHAREITGADAGSIYLVDEEADEIRFAVAENDSVPTNLGDHVLHIGDGSVVGNAVLRRHVIRSSHLYRRTMLPGNFVRHDRSIDQELQYQTRSMITAPMISPEGRVLAVIQLINAKLGSAPLRTIEDFDERVRPFTADDERLCQSLASQAAVALESARLYAEIQSLFEGFVRASVRAIEQRDPTTSGHSQRVADLTVALARAADRADAGWFAEVRFSADQLREIEYAGLLHDFGKVGVREEVLVKAKKLYPAQLQRVRARFEHMRTALLVERLQTELQRLRTGQPEPLGHERDYQRRVLEVDAMLALVLEANEPTVLPTEVSSRLTAIAGESFVDAAGQRHALLQGDELEALLIRRGSLTDAERIQIQHHVTHTYDFLVRIPWGQSLAMVPDIAARHHEYLDGSGYPSNLPAERIPLQARMMTVADIFDALTASDRPYKKAVPIPLALDILRAEQRQGKLDPQVLALFIDAKIFEGGARP
ncbi:HD-GYP domain-containing protein [Paraliomyxa miuraensis]|uniref:HD-GYP domain-containing protein n=1 Tax=Paraliomyxa miuraensis TaxID=376150 RepID=UPI00224DB953|nr:HD family phosphohydrolase [Paraliomyxa miuraensis]MCX4244438.1 GAF domain-containing protein [Paraliomyxa miuraensis]